MQISVREMRLDDYSSIRDIDEATQKQYLGNSWHTLSDTEKDACLTSRESEFEMNVNTGYCFVALDTRLIDKTHIDDECMVGFVLAYETLPYQDSLNIRYIAIHPEHQGNGIGTLLYKAVIEKAKQNKIPRIVTMINLDNPESMSLHEKVGFELVDRKQAILQLR